jgi:hypothetical protein
MIQGQRVVVQRILLGATATNPKASHDKFELRVWVIGGGAGGKPAPAENPKCGFFKSYPRMYGKMA